MDKTNRDISTKGHSLVKYLSSAEWAILPEKLEQLEEVVSQYIAGTNVKLQSKSRPMQQVNQISVIPIDGTIAKKAYGLDTLSGLRTTLDIKSDIQKAIADSGVSGIVLRIDSPGGTVDGTKELADYIKTASAEKPIVAYADGTMASAAYWIGSAANKVVAFDTSKVGSVGVVVSHQDRSKAEEEAGIKTTYIYQGKYKVSGNQSEPLSPESKEYIQKHVDTYYSLFVDAVAENRSIARDVVIKDIALGATFIGKEALELNLVDSIGSLDDAINLALTLGEEKMEDKAMKAQLDELTAKMATMSTALETAQENNTKLQEALEEEKALNKAKDEAEAARLHLEEVTAKCEGLGLTKEAIADFAKLDDASLNIVLAELSTRQEKLDKALAGLQTETDGATSDAPETISHTIDSATEMIMKRDNCDADEASDKAQVEFPDLFTF